MHDPAHVVSLHERARSGHVAALARLLSLAERDPVGVASQVWQLPGVSAVVGVTGAPGAGKSTLTSAVVAFARRREQKVAVIAVDPSSPISGGAVLGDRIRMLDHTLDPGVFIRSMATRGSSGGLSAAVPLAVRVLETVGFDLVVIETVGVGQVELDVASHADTTVVVLNPGWGDGIQANKAGILEIADVLVVNKADRPGAQDTVAQLRAAQNLGGSAWTASSIVETVATEGLGIDELMGAIAGHRAALDAHGGAGRSAKAARRAKHQLGEVIADSFLRRRDEVIGSAAFGRAARDVAARTIDPWTATQQLVDGSSDPSIEASSPTHHADDSLNCSVST
jgi:LAO/AO transport system kinase